VLIFNAHFTPVQVIKTFCAWNHISRLRQMRSCYVLTYIYQSCWRGLEGGGDPFWLHKETQTFKGPAA